MEASRLKMMQYLTTGTISRKLS